MSAIKIRTMRAHSLIEHIPLFAAVFQRRIPECFAPYLGMFSSPLSANEPRAKHASCALCLTAPSLHATDAGRQPPPRTHGTFCIISSHPFGTEKRRTYAEQEVCGRPARLARSFHILRPKFREDDAMGPRPPRRAVSTVFRTRHRFGKARDRPLPPTERVRYRLPGKGRRMRDRRRSRRTNGMSSAANTAAKMLRPRLW